MIHDKLHYYAVAVLVLLASCGTAADKPENAVVAPELPAILTSVEKSEQATLRYLEVTRSERMRIEEIYQANKLLIEQYIAEQKKTQQACKKETGNLASSRISRISPVKPLSEQQIEELNKATAAAAMEIRTGKSFDSTSHNGSAKNGGADTKSAVAEVAPVLAEPPAPIDPPYSPSDAP